MRRGRTDPAGGKPNAEAEKTAGPSQTGLPFPPVLGRDRRFAPAENRLSAGRDQPASTPVKRRMAVSFMADSFVILTTSPVCGEWMNVPSPS